MAPQALIGRIAALVGTIVVLYVVFQRVPLAELVAALEGANYSVFVPVMALNAVLLFAWDTVVLSLALKWSGSPLPYTELFVVRASCYVIGFLSMNASHGLLAIYLTRRLRIPFLVLGSTIMVVVLAEFFHLLSWALAGVLSLRGELPAVLFWTPISGLLLCIGGFAYARWGDATKATNVARSLHLPESVRRFVQMSFGAVTTSFRNLSLRQCAHLVAIRIPAFALTLGLHFVAIRAFGLNLPFESVLVFLPLIFMIAALPFTIAYVGTTQAAWILFFSRYGPESQLLAFSMAGHLTFVITRAALGLLCYPLAHVHIARCLRRDSSEKDLGA